LLVCWDEANTERKTCDSISRNAVTYDIDAVEATSANLGQLKTTGFDTQLNYTTALPDWLVPGSSSADLDVSVVWTHLTENSVQGDPASTAFECVGRFGFACDFFGNDNVFPENRARTSAAWVAENWRAGLSWYWIEGTKNSARDVAPVFGIPVDFVNPAIETIGSKSYIDFDLNYQLTENLRLGLTVANLLDEGPAFMADNGSQANTDTEMYDVFGRAYTLRLSLSY
jgi:outer membrane receptor protein involved in Fe transport